MAIPMEHSSIQKFELLKHPLVKELNLLQMNFFDCFELLYHFFFALLPLLLQLCLLGQLFDQYRQFPFFKIERIDRIKDKINQSLVFVFILDILDYQRMYRPGQKFYKVLAESALRAVRLCQPLKVPPTGYDKWKELQLNFNPTEMLKG